MTTDELLQQLVTETKAATTAQIQALIGITAAIAALTIIIVSMQILLASLSTTAVTIATILDVGSALLFYVGYKNLSNAQKYTKSKK